MGENNRIGLWDDSPERLHEMESNLRQAMQHVGVKADITFECEPPLLARNNMYGNMPAIQINGNDIWRHTIGETVSMKQFEALLRHLVREGILPASC